MTDEEQEQANVALMLDRAVTKRITDVIAEGLGRAYNGDWPADQKDEEARVSMMRLVSQIRGMIREEIARATSATPSVRYGHATLGRPGEWTGTTTTTTSSGTDATPMYPSLGTLGSLGASPSITPSGVLVGDGDTISQQEISDALRKQAETL